MIDKNIIKQIIIEIKKTDDWKETISNNSDKEFLHHYMITELFDQIIIICEFYNKHCTETDFLHWKDNKLIPIVGDEDCVLRAAHNNGVRDEIEFQDVIQRDYKNNIYEGDSDLPSPKEE